MFYTKAKQIKDVMQGKGSKKRSPLWRKVRNKHVKKHPTCYHCGGSKKIEVHHIVPFSVDPSLELDPNNLLTLCESKKGGITCHQFIGHLGNYQRYNPEVTKDCDIWKEKRNLAELDRLERKNKKGV